MSSSKRYYCVNCGSEARKPACAVTKEHNATLGTWRCGGQCQGKVKVKRA